MCSKDNINALKELPRENLKYFLAGFVDGEGSFNITDDYAIHSDSPLSNHIWHRTARWVTIKNGNVYTSQSQPDEVACF